MREIQTSFLLGVFLGAVGFCRILLWYAFGWATYDGHPYLIATTVWASLVGVVMFGSVVGEHAAVPAATARIRPATASAPFVATLVDVTGLVIYFSVAEVVLHGTLL
jgi:magnesium transporter